MKWLGGEYHPQPNFRESGPMKEMTSGWERYSAVWIRKRPNINQNAHALARRPKKPATAIAMPRAMRSAAATKGDERPAETGSKNGVATVRTPLAIANQAKSLAEVVSGVVMLLS